MENRVPSKLQDILWFGVLYFVCAVALGIVTVAFRGTDDAFFGTLVKAPVAKALLGAAVTAGTALLVKLAWRGIKRALIEPVNVLMPQLREFAEEFRQEFKELRLEMRSDREGTNARLDRHDVRLDRIDDEIYHIRRRSYVEQTANGPTRIHSTDLDGSSDAELS